MQLNIFWAGIEYNSFENCCVKFTPDGAEVQSTIVGAYGDKIYTVSYHLLASENWETTLFTIEYTLNGQENKLYLERKLGESWLLNGNPRPDFDDCKDVDLAVSPFTNSLPINRLNLTNGEAAVIAVIYCNPLTNEIRQVQQQYTKLSSGKFKYQNIPNDFEATILVDELGLVVDYPKLFNKRLIQVSKQFG